MGSIEDMQERLKQMLADWDAANGHPRDTENTKTEEPT